MLGTERRRRGGLGSGALGPRGRGLALGPREWSRGRRASVDHEALAADV
jgi:hypothetical protein